LEELFGVEITINKELIRDWRYSLFLAVNIHGADEFWKWLEGQEGGVYKRERDFVDTE
jgi:hypothetical protein